MYLSFLHYHSKDHNCKSYILQYLCRYLDFSIFSPLVSLSFNKSFCFTDCILSLSQYFLVDFEMLLRHSGCGQENNPEILSEMRNLEVRSYQRSILNVEEVSKETCWLYCTDTQTHFILNDCKLFKLSSDFESELIAE